MATDSTTGRFPKKYNNNNSNSPRSTHARLLATGSKVSAPKPVNLPSLRHEHNKGSPDSSASSPCGSDNSSLHSNNNNGGMISGTHRWGSPLHSTTNDSGSELSKNSATSPDSTTGAAPLPSATSAWATFSSTRKSNAPMDDHTEPEPESKSSVSPPKPKNEHVKVTVSHHAKAVEIPMPFTQASELSTMSWDEMVSEEMDFAVSVVNLDDQTQTSLDDPSANHSDDNDDKRSQQHQQHVSPSDRFTDDYDRGYLHTRRRHDDLYNANPTRGSYRDRQQDRFNHHPHHHDSYSNNNDHRPAYGKWNADRRGSGHTVTHGRRSSNGSNHSGASGSASATSPHQRRPSQDRSPPTIPTLLRRPHDTTATTTSNDASLYAVTSSKDDRPPDIVAAQRKAMTTAAEMAKRRREADEAERQAAAERARQKALALAPPPPPVAEKPKAPVTILTHPRKVSPGTIITTTTANTGTSHLLQEPKVLTEDEKSWADYVSKLKESDGKKGSGPDQEDEDLNTSTTTVTDWSSYAERLQQANEPAQPTTPPPNTEDPVITDAKNGEQQQQQKVSEAPSSPPQADEPVHTTITTDQLSQQAPTDEHNNDNRSSDTTRRFIKSSSKLRLANYPLFPDTIGRKVPPKPASLHFMIDQAESDDELMCILEEDSEVEESEEPLPSTAKLESAKTSPLPSVNEPVETTEPIDSPPPVEAPSPSLEPLDTSLPSEPEPTNESLPPAPELETTKEPLPVTEPVPLETDTTPLDTTDYEIPTAPEIESHADDHQHRKGLYPEGLPDPGSFFAPTHSSSHQQQRQNIVPADIGHNENYPLLMFPIHAPLSCKNGSNPLMVRLLPPGQQHPKIPSSSYGIK
ncbi:hypothetical protein [Absidia glauca]|uniref:Uncharacterized protein n=1 Tax=Absidia glauca TaxID=4829 RepID=A0A168PC60_ABSGL|nr:hypothetical protein [Absidia glauca]